MMRDPQTEAQLAMMAGSADRANRPRMIVIVCLLLAGAALVTVLAMSVQFANSREFITDRLTELEGVSRYAEQAEKLIGQEFDFQAEFPDFPSIGDEIAQIADRVTGIQPVDKITVGTPQYKAIAGLFGADPRLQEVNVRCTFQSATATNLFRWMEEVQKTPQLEGTFVTSIDMSPRGEPGRWAGSVQFRRYVYRETAR